MRTFAMIALLLLPAAARAGDGDIDEDLARSHFQMGRVYYQTEQFAKALKEFQAALVVKPLPAFYYNIARCYERMENWKEAVAAYELYLESSPHSDDAGETRSRIAELKARVASLEARERVPTKSRAPATENPGPMVPRPTEPASEGPPLSAAPPPERPSLIPPLVVGGGAIAAVAAAIGIYAWTKSDFDRLEKNPGPWNAAAKQDLWNREVTYGVLFGVAAAAAVVDAILWWRALRGRSEKSAKAPSKRAWLAPTLGGIAAGAQF